MTCTKCGHAVVDDLVFNTLMARYGLPQRRAACLNAHSYYLNAPGPEREVVGSADPVRRGMRR